MCNHWHVQYIHGGLISPLANAWSFEFNDSEHHEVAAEKVKVDERKKIWGGRERGQRSHVDQGVTVLNIMMVQLWSHNVRCHLKAASGGGHPIWGRLGQATQLGLTIPVIGPQSDTMANSA
jgi:hypothetical protein